MTRKLKKRLIVIGAMLLGGVVGTLLVLWLLTRGTPDWYRPRTMTAEQLEAAAQRATNKLAMIQNEAARARAVERASRRQQPNSTTLPTVDPITVSFTDDEMNAFFDKWSVLQGVKGTYEKYLTDPYIVLQDGRMILAGRVKDLGTVASVHVEPTIDPKGKLELKLVRILAGKLPLPESVLSRYETKATTAIERRMPTWRQHAAIDSTGVANSSAISAAMGRLFVNVIGQRPSPPVLFLPLIDRGSVPVKVRDVKIEDHTLTLTVIPMTSDERAQLLRRIQDDSTASADQ